MSTNNSRWELWAAIQVNASSAVTAARVIPSQTGKFRASLGATGISRAAAGVWLVHLAPSEGLSGPDCYMTVTPNYTQFLSADVGDVTSGAVAMTASSDNAVRKRISIIAMRRGAASAVNPVRENIPFTLTIYRRTA